ncbi:hypothetical protein HNQ94_001659 [Salirhabdus euzebyi]|uniref:Uncharacterized protein n=1 Tax=Salirhabdus euzebyi TaxID=394506 RepID=A0A841Q468_9BACI|nr:hypothetical protein [Salirhabdus euzebyi]MBB6453211.1 hypothetical protein [Salirhabdus euzebyi]
MKIENRSGKEYSIQKDGSQYKITRTIKNYDSFENAKNDLIDLASGRKTEEQVQEEKKSNLH